MQFIQLDNMTKLLRIFTNQQQQVLVDKGGTSRNYRWYNSQNAVVGLFPFYYTGITSFENPQDSNTLFAAASSEANIPSNTTTVTNKVGITSLQKQNSTNGITIIVSVSGSEGDTINSLFFGKRAYDSNNYYPVLLYALKLDTPVTIDSTGTANFTFAIEF